MKTEILSILRQTKGYVSGQELCERLGVSRTAVWKCIKKLQEEGYEIQGINRKGYRLVEIPDVMTPSEIENCLWQKRKAEEITDSRESVCTGRTRSKQPDCAEKKESERAGCADKKNPELPDRHILPYRVLYKDEIDSTNTWAKREAEMGASEGSVLVADMQTAGKGRRGRSWSSPSGHSVYMSLILRPDILPERASMLTLVAGLSVAQAVRHDLGLDAWIKWPNDVVISGKKICGILTEMSLQMECINYVVIGIGINVNLKDFPKDIADKATSLCREKGENVHRAEVIAAVLHRFEKNYFRFLKRGNLADVKDSYNEILINCGRKICVLEPGNEYTAISGGINEKGELLVTKDDGTKAAVYAGEVSVRGLYGYV
ncbi:MAG: biotin--[acetyl-CoA-carboxylase] ligase [Lachnospiraceae bacterium]|nr:biotin--[acetyl-CoA-carboxylase] ligase [Lachnospiraceae bacterium]